MTKTLALTLSSLLLLVGCNIDKESIAPQGKTYTFQWASFEQYKVKQLVEKHIEENAVFPDELSFDQAEHNRKRSELNQSIRTKEKTAKEACDAKFLPSDANQSLPQEIRSLQGGVVITDPDWDKYYKIRSSKEYLDCVTTGRDSPDIIELKTALEKEDNLQRKKSEFLNKLKKDGELVFRKYVAEYAQENHLDLILTRQSDAIIYNKNDGILDITIPLEAYIQSKLQPLTNNQ